MRTSYLAWSLLLITSATCGDEEGSVGEYCSSRGITCGTVTTDDFSVECGLCRYTAEEVTMDAPSSTDPVLADGTDQPVVAFGTFNGVRVATRGADGWTVESVTSTTGSIERVDIAIAGDTRYVAFIDGSSAAVATSVAGGAWTVEPLSGSARSLSLALDPAGAPIVAMVGFDAMGMPGVVLYDRASGSWQGTRIADTTSLEPALVVELAYTASTRHVFFARSEMLFEIIDAAAPVQIGVMTRSSADTSANSLDTALDAQGRLHLLFESGSGAIHQVLQGGSWVADPPAPSWRDGGNALALASDGQVFVAYHTTAALELAERVDHIAPTPGGWAHQLISGECDGGQVDLAIAPDDTLRMVRTCGSGVFYLERVGVYPADYLQTCNDLVATTCEASCGCATGAADPDCCLRTSGFTACSSAFGCSSNTAAYLCGDATQDPADVYACAAELAAPMCFMDTTDGSAGIEFAQESACGRLLGGQ